MESVARSSTSAWKLDYDFLVVGYGEGPDAAGAGVAATLTSGDRPPADRFTIPSPDVDAIYQRLFRHRVGVPNRIGSRGVGRYDREDP